MLQEENCKMGTSLLMSMMMLKTSRFSMDSERSAHVIDCWKNVRQFQQVKQPATIISLRRNL
jgi:hypothetical protein